MNYSSYFLASCLCVVLGYASCLSQGFITGELRILREYFNESTSEVSDDGPLFLNMMDRWKEESDKNILMSQIVTVYFKIFEAFKNNSSIQSSLQKIKIAMLNTLFNSNSSKENDFTAVINTQVNDLKVQRKAIFELPRFMNDLSAKNHVRRRKRRQNRNQGELKQ
ncbi:interferon gamma [Dromiciops gliroides]|uniref:interferon gamma n=1 Tax=Dromiciops gliroides TaxID=33562 RepID=UPI001CC70DD2|nr:interferon gamma [Dromiciops gliroides]